MERGEFRSFSSPPDFPSSSPSFSATVSAVRAEEDEVSFPSSPPYIVKNKLSPSKPSPILPGSFISPSPCPDSGGSSSSSSPFAFASASNLAFQRPSAGTASSSTAACPLTLSYSPSSAVRSRASVRAPGRVDYEDAYTHSGTFITRDGVCVLPSHRMQRTSVSKHLGVYTHGDERSGGNSAHAAEYYSAGEENDLSPVLPNYQKHVPLNVSSLEFNVSRSRREHAFAVSTENAESGDVRIAPFAANQRSCRVHRCRTAAESSVGAVSASGEHASTAEQLSTQETPEEPQSNDGWQQQQQRGGKELQQQQPQQHGQDFLLVRQQWKDRFEPPLPLLSDGLQQGQRRRSVRLETLERRVQRLFQSDAACRLTRRAVPRGQQSLTVSSPSKSAEVQLLLERMRMFYGSSSDAAAAAASTSDGSAVPAFSPLNKGNSSSADSFPARTKMPPIPSCAENFRHATARRQRGLCGPADAGRRPAPGEQEADVQVYPRQPPQPQQASENELQKRGQTEVKTKKKKLRDRRIIFVCALLFLDVIIIGSTSTQHALNPASLVDKVLLTHVSFSASLCSLSGGSPAAVAECLASAAAGNAAAAAAASSGATGNRVDERTGLLSAKGQDQQQPDLPQLQQQLLQEPFLLPHFDRYLPHSFKRELGLSCVCGWAALVVLGVMCLWVAVRDTSVGAHVFPAVISARPGAGGGASVDKKEERTTVCDSSSLTSFSREGNNTCSSPNTSSRGSSPCSSPTDRKETFLSACGRVGEAGVCASFCGPACRSSSKSSSPACYGCSSCSTRPPETVMTANSSSSKSSGFLDRLLRPCRRRITAAESRTEEETGGGGGGGAAAAAGEEGGALGSGRSRRRGLANVSSAEAVGVFLREYEETVVQEYQTRTFIQGRARLFCVSLLALLVFFGMNFVVQLNVRCHRTKYHFYTLQSLAAAARERGGNVGRAGAGGDMGRNSSREDQTGKRELPTTPNTPWLPLKMLLHAQQPAAASAAFYFGEEGEGGEEEMQQLERDEAEEELQPQDSKEGGGESADTANDEGKQVEKQGSRPFNHKQGPRTSPSYVYYRDYQFWYQLFADSCRDAEMQLSVAWIVLHLTAVIMCRNMRREADENVRAALRAFRRRYKHLLCSGSRTA